MNDDSMRTQEFEDEIEAAKANEQMISEDESQHIESESDVALRNISLVETNIKLIGDRTVIAQAVQLLSYIRHALRNNMAGNLMLSFGQEKANVDFNFDVNGMQVPDLVTPADYRIN